MVTSDPDYRLFAIFSDGVKFLLFDPDKSKLENAKLAAVAAREGRRRLAAGLSDAGEVRGLTPAELERERASA